VRQRSTLTSDSGACFGGQAVATIHPPRHACSRHWGERFHARDMAVMGATHFEGNGKDAHPVPQEHQVPHRRSIAGSAFQRAPSNNALNLTKGAKVRTQLATFSRRVVVFMRPSQVTRCWADQKRCM
jgi:hypothetical protein